MKITPLQDRIVIKMIGIDDTRTKSGIFVLDSSKDKHVKGEVIAVGNGPVDIDILEFAGLGIAYRAPPDVRCHADIVIDDLRLILNYIEEPLQTH